MAGAGSPENGEPPLELVSESVAFGVGVLRGGRSSGAATQATSEMGVWPAGLPLGLQQCLGARLQAPQTWLILPAVICLSQRLSHACLSVSFYMAGL